MNDLITVVIPVYNTEKYLNRCVESIINQTYQNLEIILINDGSTDNSGEVCNQYAEKDSRITVIHQKNSGVSSARNKGLDIAKGEYITFVDSDDYVQKDFISKLYKALINNNCDMSICGYNIIENNKIRTKATIKKDIKLYDSFLDYHLNINIFQGFLCNKLFKKDLINELRLDEKIYYCEDQLFVTKYIFKCKNFCYITEPLYNYVKTEDSASSIKKWDKKKMTVLNSLSQQINLLKEYDFIYYKEYYITKFRFLNDIYHRYLKTKNLKVELKKMYKKIINNNDYTIKEKIEVFIKYYLFNFYNLIRNIKVYFKYL